MPPLHLAKLCKKSDDKKSDDVEMGDANAECGGGVSTTKRALLKEERRRREHALRFYPYNSAQAYFDTRKAIWSSKFLYILERYDAIPGREAKVIFLDGSLVSSGSVHQVEAFVMLEDSVNGRSPDYVAIENIDLVKLIIGSDIFSKPLARIILEPGTDLDDICEIDGKPRGQFNRFAASILTRILYAARMARFDFFRVTCRLATRISYWIGQGDKPWLRLVRYVWHRVDDRRVGFVGGEIAHTSLRLFCDADFAGDAVRQRSTGGVHVALRGPRTIFPLKGLPAKQDAD